jgi:predicted SprT family Zn-dependent metalloprotease
MTPQERIEQWLNQLLIHEHQHVHLTLTRTRHSKIRLQRTSPRHWILRMHEQFIRAPDSLLDNLASFIIHQDPNAWKRVAAFARTIDVDPETKRVTSPQPRRTRGHIFDLQRELELVKKGYFDTPPAAEITWGTMRKSRRRTRRSIRFGSWHENQKLVRIHPLLDQKWVPLEFIHYLIYHELCHAVAKPEMSESGRNRIHHRAFKDLESTFPNLKAMEKLSTDIFKRLCKEGF